MSVPVGVGPQVNEFEQVSSDDHQMSAVGGRLEGLILLGVGGRSPGLMSEGGYPTYPMMHLMLPPNHPLDRITDGQKPVKQECIPVE